MACTTAAMRTELAPDVIGLRMLDSVSFAGPAKGFARLGLLSTNG